LVAAWAAATSWVVNQARAAAAVVASLLTTRQTLSYTTTCLGTLHNSFSFKNAFCDHLTPPPPPHQLNGIRDCLTRFCGKF
jgi:hypothetical protein